MFKRVSIGWRFFLFEDDGTVRRIPQRKVDRLLMGKIAFPEYAGRTMRAAFVILELQDGRPTTIANIEGSKRHFDREGCMRPRSADATLESGVFSLAEEPPSRDGNVIYIDKFLARKRRDEMYRWDPSPADITRMIEFIWERPPGLAKP